MHSGGNSYGGVNDTRDASLTSATCGSLSSVSDSMQVGATGSSGFFQGDIAELIAFNTALSETQRENVKTTLANKYAITLPYSYSPNPNDNLQSQGRAFTIEGWFKVPRLAPLRASSLAATARMDGKST